MSSESNQPKANMRKTTALAKDRDERIFREVFHLRETNCAILSDSKDAISAARNSISHHRKQLEQYAAVHPEFVCSLNPVTVFEAPRVVRLMAEVSEKADVGPMAAVAGVLADLAVEDMVLAGSRVAVVENGGEISAVSDQAIDVALSAGDSPLSGHVGFRLQHFPAGIATSSGLFSHALSFGDAEAVTIFAANAGLADAAATAVGNLIKGGDRRVVEHALKEALRIEGVKGATILYRGVVGRAGETPQLLKIRGEPTHMAT